MNTPDPELLTTAEVMHMLRIGRTALDALVASGRLPVIRLTARTHRYRREAVDALLADSRWSPRAPGDTATEVAA